MRGRGLWAAVALIGVAAAFRVWLLGQPVRFHADEALFAAYARDAAVRGEWLLPGALDKTPLSIYGQAVMMLLVGIEPDGAIWRLPVERGEFAARLWGVFVSLLTVAVTMRVAGRLVARARLTAAIAAGGLVALSPYGVAFGPTAFTDGGMVLCVMLAVWMALRGRGAWAGVWVALGYASKQQALLFVPLVAGLLWLDRRHWRHWVRMTAALATGLAVLGVWDALRSGPAVWALAAQNNVPGRWIVSAGDVLPRLWEGLALLRWLFGGGVVTALVVSVAAAGLMRGRVWHAKPVQTGANASGRVGRATGSPLQVITVFLAGYGVLHWLVPLNIYDRYVLAVMPLAAVVAGVGVSGWVWHAKPVQHGGGMGGRVTGLPLRIMVMFLVGMAMLPAAWRAANGALPIGGDEGQHADIIAVADYLNEQAFGAIVYDRWLGWELRYYLGAWTDKRRAYYPTPWAMVTDPAVFVPDVAPRYFPVPAGENAWPWRAAWHVAGFEVCTGYQSTTTTVVVLHRPAVEPSAARLARAACAGQGTG